MPSGNVKWFNPTKGYGFIQPSDGGKDVFVHISAVERAGLSTLNEGQRVEYELVSNRGKTSAENLKVTLSRRFADKDGCLWHARARCARPRASVCCLRSLASSTVAARPCIADAG